MLSGLVRVALGLCSAVTMTSGVGREPGTTARPSGLGLKHRTLTETVRRARPGRSERSQGKGCSRAHECTRTRRHAPRKTQQEGEHAEMGRGIWEQRWDPACGRRAVAGDQVRRVRLPCNSVGRTPSVCWHRQDGDQRAVSMTFIALDTQRAGQENVVCRERGAGLWEGAGRRAGGGLTQLSGPGP